MSDIIGTIDAAIGCQHCEGPLGGSPSADFCSPECQQAWHAARSKPLERYMEASRAIVGFDAARYRPAGDGESPWLPPAIWQACEANRDRTAEFRRVFLNGQRRASDPPSDALIAAVLAHGAQAARTGLYEQAIRQAQARWTDVWQDLTVVGLYRDAELAARHLDLTDTVEVAGDAYSRGVMVGWPLVPRTIDPVQVSAAAASFAEAIRRAQLVMQRALELRRNRNTGPQRRPRAPRSIDRL